MLPRVEPDAGGRAEDEGRHRQAGHQHQGSDHPDQHRDHVALRLDEGLESMNQVHGGDRGCGIL